MGVGWRRDAPRASHAHRSYPQCILARVPDDGASGLPAPRLSRRRGPAPMSVVVAAAHLRWEMARRGLNQAALARRSGLTPATISTALRGAPIAERTLRLLALALMSADPVPGADDLLAPVLPDSDGPIAATPGAVAAHR